MSACVRARDEPLDPVTWLRQLERLQISLQDPGECGTVDHGMRQAYYLARLAPDPLWLLFGSQVPEDVFERAMDQGDTGLALDAIVNAGLEVATERQGVGWSALVRLVGSNKAGEAAAAGREQAVLLAWIACIRVV